MCFEISFKELFLFPYHTYHDPQKTLISLFLNNISI